MNMSAQKNTWIVILFIGCLGIAVLATWLLTLDKEEWVPAESALRIGAAIYYGQNKVYAGRIVEIVHRGQQVDFDLPGVNCRSFWEETDYDIDPKTFKTIGPHNPSRLPRGIVMGSINCGWRADEDAIKLFSFDGKNRWIPVRDLTPDQYFLSKDDPALH
jgi:hypothetical protein